MSLRSLRPSPLLHPASLVSLAVLALNDHYLKQHHPSFLTGKLSDVAFMVVAPLFLFVAGRFVFDKWLASRDRVAQIRWQLFILGFCIALIGSFFVAMQLTVWGDSAYRIILGTLQWPARAAYQLLVSASLPRFPQIQATPDPTDLFCLPFLTGAWLIGRESIVPLSRAQTESP